MLAGHGTPEAIGGGGSSLAYLVMAPWMGLLELDGVGVFKPKLALPPAGIEAAGRDCGMALGWKPMRRIY